MDPNEALRQIRELIREIEKAQDEGRLTSADEERPGLLVAPIQALDRWLTTGGFLPVSWESALGGDHEIRLVRRQKMDTPRLVAAVCRCGYESGPSDQHGASKAGAQHLAAKWEE